MQNYFHREVALAYCNGGRVSGYWVECGSSNGSISMTWIWTYAFI